jgi:hypothetical protein
MAIVHLDFGPGELKSSFGMQKFIELLKDNKQTGDSVLVQSKGMKTIYISSIIKIIKK